MIDKIQARLKDRFVIGWLSVVVLILLVVGAKVLFFSQASPSIEDVLSRSPQNSFDFSMFIASLLALSLASISVAKGYEILKKNHCLTGSVMPEVDADSIRAEIDCEEISELKQGLIRLEKDKDELAQKVSYLGQENTELKEQASRLTFDHGEVSRAEQMLRKSNISLSRECERLKAENEVLLLKLNSFETEAPQELLEEPAPKKKRTRKTKAQVTTKTKTRAKKKGTKKK